MRITHPSRTLTFLHLHLSKATPTPKLLHFQQTLAAPSMADTTENTPLANGNFDGTVQTTAANGNIGGTVEATANGSVVNGDFDGAVVSDDLKYGFQRSEMYKETLSGTVDAYDRHVFVCYKTPESWAPRVEASDADLLPKLLASAVKARKDDISVKTKITVIGGGDGTEFADGDVLIFPEMIRYKGLEESNVDSFVVDVLVNGKPWSSGVPEVLTGSHIFVCAHASRDKRCGVCGPVLMDNLKQGIEARGLKDQVFVTPCSHIGGHKYAGNLIVYSPDSEGKISGHWYGYVTPKDIPELLDQHIAKGEVIERLWRGQIGAPIKEGKKDKGQKLSNKENAKKSNKVLEETIETFPTETLTSCCQGANGVSCCRDETSDQNSEKSCAPEKSSTGRLSCLMKNWDQADVLTGVAVVGAVATIAVAFSFYRRSS